MTRKKKQRIDLCATCRFGMNQTGRSCDGNNCSYTSIEREVYQTKEEKMEETGPYRNFSNAELEKAVEEINREVARREASLNITINEIELLASGRGPEAVESIRKRNNISYDRANTFMVSFIETCSKWLSKLNRQGTNN